MKFNVSVTETLSRLVEVEAESKEKALVEIKLQWESEGIVLGNEDFQDVKYEIEEI